VHNVYYITNLSKLQKYENEKSNFLVKINELILINNNIEMQNKENQSTISIQSKFINKFELIEIENND
jgi:hypothetical protein